MNTEELIQLTHEVIGENREVSLVSIFEDSMGKSIKLRFEAPKTGEKQLHFACMRDIGMLHKKLQDAQLWGYSLEIYVVVEGKNRYIFQTEIEARRPLAYLLRETGNKFRVEAHYSGSPKPTNLKKYLIVDDTGIFSELQWKVLLEGVKKDDDYPSPEDVQQWLREQE